mmetsp:Transcript_10970/g.24162  ORF Transcript_10970/g.24162 Transcript_10970/m.24162 type:complete len:407 (-) Transcript_10970:150-1370(-)
MNQGPHPRSPAGLFEAAIDAVQQALGISSSSLAERTAVLNDLLQGPARENPDVRRILVRNGWVVADTEGETGFRSTPDCRRILQDLQNRSALLGTGAEDSAHRFEERRFREQYHREDTPLGEGTYGTVYRARCLRTNKYVAIKRVKPDVGDDGVPSTAIREVAVLKTLRHRNVVALLDVCCCPGQLDLVFEFVEVNLRQYMKRFSMQLQPKVVTSLMHQLLLALEYCHSRRILHRDLKPQNLLIEVSSPGADPVLKVADLGMARAFVIPIQRLTHEVVTTWYRPPEILFGTGEYALAVDMWSSGCILGEMASGTPLFHGDSEIDTIFQIFKKLGTPTIADWPDLVNMEHFKTSFPKWPRRNWEDIRDFGRQLGPHGVALIDGLLQYNPVDRLSARRALLSEYFGAL